METNQKLTHKDKVKVFKEKFGKFTNYLSDAKNVEEILPNKIDNEQPIEISNE